jgi:hypothetical protein
MKNDKVKPDFHIVEIDQSEFYPMKNEGEKVIASYLFDKNSYTYIASLDPTYLLYPMDIECDEEHYDEYLEAHCEGGADYYSVRSIDSLPHRRAEGIDLSLYGIEEDEEE